VTASGGSFDVVVAGGGPGGSITATRLAQLGRRVLVLEQEDFPRFHLGESLLPDSVPVLDAVGVLPAVDERFLRKPGAVFHDNLSERAARFDFGDAFSPKCLYAYQVPRDEFDALLLSNAAAKGAEVRHRWSVTRIRFDGSSAVGVDAKGPDGEEVAIGASFVVDATGRQALLARARRSTDKIAGLENTALYSQWRGVAREAGPRAGDFHLVMLGDEGRADRGDCVPPTLGWLWVIPFKDGRTSVGAALSNAFLQKHGGAGEGGADALYRRVIETSRGARRFLEGAEQLWPARATADFSFRVSDLAGDGWLMVGDSGGFIDPLFSTGAHLAMCGGFHAAEAIHAALAVGDLSRVRFAPWEARMRSGADLFLTMVQAFYEGPLARLFFVDRPHPFMRKVITSLLAGNVFDENARWIGEARTRLTRGAMLEMLGS
jgi:flavin-dependent dehydrogenase